MYLLKKNVQRHIGMRREISYLVMDFFIYLNKTVLGWQSFLSQLGSGQVKVRDNQTSPRLQSYLQLPTIL